MKKYIHYCWFGGKPLSKLAKTCIKSWKEFLPDYELKLWNEENCNINECSFVKEAYENKKWAFVADYFRTKALADYGGIYFDTDMKVIKNIDNILKDKTVLGFEDSINIAAGFWYEPKPKGYLTQELLNFYQSQSGFDKNEVFSYSIPKLITRILNLKDIEINPNNICDTKSFTIYPRDYFYPLSYDKQNNIFTKNTCMIHYYDASWTPKSEQREIKLIRKHGYEKANNIIYRNNQIKHYFKKGAKLCLYPLVKIRRKKLNQQMTEKEISDLNNIFKRAKINNNIAVIYNIAWLGTSFAAQELFDNCIGIGTMLNEKVCDYCANLIVNIKAKLLIFNAFDISWYSLVKKIKEKKPSQRIKILWHGSNAMNVEEYDWNSLNLIFELLKNNDIESIGLVKKSLYEFYRSKGYKVEFVMNTININNNLKHSKKSNYKNITKIGVYASGDRWVKNFYNQLSAASMIENHRIDCIPINKKTLEFSELIKANINGETKPIPREKLLKRIAQNDINLYVTFVECAPLLPLESFEMGVPCITANNHHYWENTELEKYLIVDSPDNIISIKEKIEFALENKDKIMKLYKAWKKEYDKKVKESVEKFIE